MERPSNPSELQATMDRTREDSSLVVHIRLSPRQEATRTLGSIRTLSERKLNPPATQEPGLLRSLLIQSALRMLPPSPDASPFHDSEIPPIYWFPTTTTSSGTAVSSNQTRLLGRRGCANVARFPGGLVSPPPPRMASLEDESCLVSSMGGAYLTPTRRRSSSHAPSSTIIPRPAFHSTSVGSAFVTSSSAGEGSHARSQVGIGRPSLPPLHVHDQPMSPPSSEDEGSDPTSPTTPSFVPMACSPGNDSNEAEVRGSRASAEHLPDGISGAAAVEYIEATSFLYQSRHDDHALWPVQYETSTRASSPSRSASSPGSPSLKRKRTMPMSGEASSVHSFVESELDGEQHLRMELERSLDRPDRASERLISCKVPRPSLRVASPSAAFASCASVHRALSTSPSFAMAPTFSSFCPVDMLSDAPDPLSLDSSCYLDYISSSSS